MKNLKKTIQKHWFLFFLFLLVILSHFFLLKDGVIPFQFDHGKDSLAVMDMWLNKNPKLIGPWTSIPGLYFGPAWYYLILPSFIIGNWSPMAPVYLMVLLLLLQVYLAYRYLGKEEAAMMATAPAWLMISTSAWNPFPMTLISLVILIILKKIKEQKKASVKQLFLLAIAASLGCHFSTAFAFLYPILILLSLWHHKIKLNGQKILILLIGYALPFLPQLVFELRHNFIETKAVLNYLTIGESQAFDWQKVSLILQNFWSQWKTSVLPNFYFPEMNIFNQIILFFAIFLFLLSIRNYLKAAPQRTKGFFSLPFEYLTWLLIPFVTYCFLHFNVWYILALAPLMVMLTGDFLRHLRTAWRASLVILLVLSLLIKVLYFNLFDKESLARHSNFLPAKIEALKLIREDAAGATFNSYQYAPDIYDFSYQYLYFQQALDGEQLPKEFSYKPGEISYIVEKSELLNHFSQQQVETKPKYNYFIVEPAVINDYQDSWWDQFGLRPDNLQIIPTRSQLLIYRQEL